MGGYYRAINTSIYLQALMRLLIDITQWQNLCLSSLGLSQGIVYQICDEAVIKVPFQYPVAKTLPADEDEINDQIHMSLRSFALFKKECAFYAVLAQNRHPNLLQRLQSRTLSGIVLPCLRSLEQAWGVHTKRHTLRRFNNCLLLLNGLENLDICRMW
jgi:hypothetical protein